MRRFLFLLFVAVFLYSCATTGDDSAGAEPVEEPEQIADVSVAEAVETEVEEPEAIETEVEVEEPEPEPEPVPTVLRFVSPEDTTIFNSRDLHIAVEGVGETTVSLSTLELDFIGGPILANDSGILTELDASSLPDALRRVTLPLSFGRVTVRLPAGLIDGEHYTWRARGTTEGDGMTTEWTEIQSTVLELGTVGPTLSPVGATIDSTPTLSWQIEDDGSLYELRIIDLTGATVFETATTAGRVSVSPELLPGRYAASVRAYRADGIVTRYGDPQSLRVRDDAAPQPLWPRDGEQTLGTRVGLQWSVVAGAISYEAQYRAVGTEQWNGQPVTINVYTPIQVSLSLEQQYEWQVRARNDEGRWFSWSDVGSFVVRDHGITFAPVIVNGETAVFQRGYADGSRDEQPVRQITLTAPFEMAISPLTNAGVALLVNFGLDKGFVQATGEGIYTLGDDPLPLLGLGEMDYGVQFGLMLEEGRLRPVAGYEEHPAIGLTWNGAVQIANLLSYAEGRTPAYTQAGEEWDPTSDGYRLPTEAEWEYAARGATPRIFPWGDSLSGRVSNYYRSFDPFEDVNDPFTRAGGPTSPTGYFSGQSRGGFQTVNDASPFGIRDLVGNVWEWCWDRYDPGYYELSDDIDPVGPAESDFRAGDEAIVLAVALDPNQRVVRGSAWNSRATDVRLTNRGRYTELGRSYSISVRLVRSPQ